MILSRGLGRIPSVLTETTTFLNVASTYLGGAVTMETLQSIDRFVRDCKVAGVWDKLLEVYPFCGSNITAASAKLKYVNPSLPNVALVNFIFGDYSERGANGGLLGDGSTKYVDCQYPCNLIPAAAHVCAYLREDVSTGTYWVGANNPGLTEILHLGSTAGTNQSGIMGTTTAVTVASAPVKGFYYLERQSATSLTLYKDNAQIGQSVVNTVPTYPALNVFAWGRNNGGAPASYVNRRLSFISIGLPMSAAERAALFAAVTSLQTNLQRNV